MSDQLDLFPEAATRVDESKRRRAPQPRTKPEWQKLAKIKGQRSVCSQCALERWRRERPDVHRVTYRRVAVDGSVLELCSEHAELLKAGK